MERFTVWSKAIVEKGYRCLSQIDEKYYDKYEVGMKVVKFIKDDKEILIETYMKLNGLKLDVIFLKSLRNIEWYQEEDKDIFEVILK